MMKKLISWGIIFALLVTMLPISVAATDGKLSENGTPTAVTAYCTCNAQPDAEGNVIHAEGCPMADMGKLNTDEPLQGEDEPLQGEDEPLQGEDEPLQGEDEPLQGEDEPLQGEDEPLQGEDEPLQGEDEPLQAEDEDAAEGTEEMQTDQEEANLQELTPPALNCSSVDEFSTNDMMLCVEGEWDSYTWEYCNYGFWSDWEADGPSLILSKEDFVSYAFRCTVTRGEQSVTSEAFAYDPSVLERPMLMSQGLSGNSLGNESDYIRYYQTSDNQFDIQGVDDNKKFQTTYWNDGYRTAISVNGGSKVRIPYAAGSTNVGSSLSADVDLDIVYGGRYVKITYIVKNNGSTAQNFRIGSSADVMIHNNDYAEVKGTSTGLSMDGAPKNNYQFSLVAPNCDTLWYGFFSFAYGCMFDDLEDKTKPYKGDSGMAWSWNGTIAPGQTWSRYVLIGAGELPASPEPPNLTNWYPYWKAGEEVTITGNASGCDTVYFSIDGQEFSAPVDTDGNFSLSIEAPDLSEGEIKAAYWGSTDEGGISSVKNETVMITTEPIIQLKTDKVMVMEDDTIGLEWLRSFIQSNPAEVEISPQSIDTNEPKEEVVTYTLQKQGYDTVTKTLTVKVLPKSAALTKTSVTSHEDSCDLSAKMEYTGGVNYKETGFVYGALQNPTLSLNDGKIFTTPVVASKGGEIKVTIENSKLAYGVNYYARAYAIAEDGTVIYGSQSDSFGVGAAQYGAFSVTNEDSNIFTISRENGSDGEQIVYYRTVNGSAIGGTHFAHTYGTLKFSDGDATSQTVSVTEYGVTQTYGDNAATAYANDDRTYSLEIYRITGGAGKTAGKESAVRTLDKNANYEVNRQLFNTYQTTELSGATLRGDWDDDKLGWGNSGNKGSAAQSTIDFSGLLPQKGYWEKVAQELRYRFSMQAKEENDGYQHIQIVMGDNIDLAFYPYQGTYRKRGTDNTIRSLEGNEYTALYAAIFEHGGDEKNGTYADYSFPKNSDMSEIYKNSAYPEDGDYLVLASSDASGILDAGGMKLTVGFSGSGNGNDKWYSNQEKHAFLLYDGREPQLLGVAPMAGGSYLEGDSVTVALVFDEIVDENNSPGLNHVSIDTNWGTFTYAGGVNTNVLYFTGKVEGDAAGNLKVESIHNAENIKDMADVVGTSINGSVTGGDTSASLGNGANAPSVTINPIANTNGTLTANVTTQNAQKLEYAWTNSNEMPTTGWVMVRTDTTLFTTRQTSGKWYLHVRVTNGEGVSATAYASIDLNGTGTVTLPELTVAADNTNWAQSREIKVVRNPSDALVQVKTPDGNTSEVAVSENKYDAMENGTYTFTLTSGDEIITKTAAVSKIDRIDPQVEIVQLSNQTHTEAVTLTVNVNDAESGIFSVTGIWSDGSSTLPAQITGENGVYTTTSPNASGNWALEITAKDCAGNTTTIQSAAYGVDLSAPSITVTKRVDSDDHGVTYDYTITAGNSKIISVQMPEGFALDEDVTLPSPNQSISGSLTFTESGSYHIIVTDEAGHVVTSQPMDVTVTQDLTAPQVRLSASTNGNAELQIYVSVIEEGSASVTAMMNGSLPIPLTKNDDGTFAGTFTVTTAGTYTLTVTDGAGNQGTSSIKVCAVTFDSNGGSNVVTQLVVPKDRAIEPSVPVREGYTFEGWYQNGTKYDFAADVTDDVTLTADWTALPASAPTVEKSVDVTQAYGISGTGISVSATAPDGYDYYYQWYSNVSNSNENGTIMTGETGSSYTIPQDTAVGKHYYYCEVTAKRQDNGQIASTSSDVITVTIEKAGQTAPDIGEGYSFDYKEETIHFDETLYEVYTAETGGMQVNNGSKVQPGDTLYIRKHGNDTHEPSLWTVINVPARPAAPVGITATNETVQGKKDGTVSGITSQMQYHTGDGFWKDGTGETLSNLPGGTTVTVRYPAGNETFASEETVVTIQSSNETLKVTFLENGGTDVSDAENLSYGDKISAPEISREGYTLEGWYSNDKAWNFSEDTVTDNMELEAKWKVNTYKITYNLDGGSLAGGVSNPDSYTIETPTFTLHQPKKTGYAFAGWTEGEDTTLTQTVTISQGSTGDKTYTAHWVMDAFTVTLTADRNEVTYGDSISLTVSGEHSAAGLNYTYVWFKDGSPMTAQDSTLSLSKVADSGSYSVKVTASDGKQSYEASSEAVVISINKKDIFATWSGLNVVYGDTIEAKAALSDIKAGDAVEAEIEGLSFEDAGVYPLTAVLQGEDAGNYNLKNSTATLTILNKPVGITITNNATVADNIVMPVIKTSEPIHEDNYKIVYKDKNGNVVTNPTQPGSYEVWVEFSEDSNYCHLDGSREAQVGTFTIANVQPQLYTAEFTGGGNISGLQSAGGSVITLPMCTITKTGEKFIGWQYGSKMYQPGDSFTMPWQNVTFTAQWQDVFKVTGTIDEETEQGKQTVAGAVVSLWLGANKIGETVTGDNGEYSFDNLIQGIYNVVVTKDVRTITRMEDIDKNTTCNISLSKGATNSIVKVEQGSPDIVVGKLNTVFEKTDDTVFTEEDQTRVNVGGKVEITFTAAQKAEIEVSKDLEKIEKISGKSSLGLVMDYKLEKTVIDENGTLVQKNPITESNVLLEILLPLPKEMQDKKNYSLYRVHEGVAQELTTTPSGDTGEYFTVSRDKTSMTLNVKCFSTYVIGYTENKRKPSDSDSAYSPSVVQPEHGTISTSPTEPKQGDQVTITVAPEEGYEVDQIVVTDANGKKVEVIAHDNGTYTFIQPDGTVSISAVFRKIEDTLETTECPRDESCPMAPFDDADRFAWYHDGIHYCVEHGLMVGIGENTFSPNSDITRGMIVAILWRLEGSPVVDNVMDYTDVKPLSWYEEAVRWADSTGVITGYGNGKFGPNDPITREQMASMLWRYAGSPEVDGTLATFVDEAKTSSWARSSMIWCVEQGLISGMGENQLDPAGQATRAQAATILMQFAKNNI